MSNGKIVNYGLIILDSVLKLHNKNVSLGNAWSYYLYCESMGI